MYPNTYQFLTQNAWGSGPANTAFPTSKGASSDGTTTNFLSAADPAVLRITNADTFLMGGWISNTSIASNTSAIFAKGAASGTNLSYQVGITNNTGLLQFRVCKTSANALTTLTGTTAIATSTPAFVLCWYDGATINIQVNNGTVDSVAHVPTAFSDPGGTLKILSNTTLSGFAGTVDEWFFGKNPANMATAISTVNSSIYNGGTGRRLYTVSATDRNAIGLVSWWGLDEASGASRSDLYGGVTLTLNGTVSQATPLVA